MSGVDSHPIIQSLKKVQEFLAKNDDKKYHRFYNAGYLMEHKITPKSLQPKVSVVIVLCTPTIELFHSPDNWIWGEKDKIKINRN